MLTYYAFFLTSCMSEPQTCFISSVGENGIHTSVILTPCKAQFFYPYLRTLGSGAARGWSHIGVINALKKVGIEIDIVAGC